MKKIAVNVHYEGIDYLSNYLEYDESEEKALKRVIEKITTDECTHFVFNCDNKVHTFPKYVIQRAVLTLIYELI